MHRRHLWLVPVAALLAAVAAGCGGGGSKSSSANTQQSATTGQQANGSANATAGKPRIGGTLIFGSEQEPPCMNPFLNDCNNTWMIYYTEQVLRSAFVTDPQFRYIPDLVSRADVQMNPQRITYHIRPQAKWNDGVPVTAKDFIFTWKTILNKAWDKKPTGGGIISRVGYDQIVNAKTADGGKSVTFTFKPAFADWKDLFTTILPQHALQGEDLTKVFINDLDNPKTGKPISDGPFLFTKWNKGASFTLVRNTKWWGPHRPYLDKIVARFLTDSNTEIQQLKGGEVDAIYPQPQLPLAQLRHQKGVTVVSNLGPNWEHIDINMKKGGPLLKQAWVRQALMLSINRKQVVDSLFAKLTPSLEPLNNLIYLNNNPHYQPHFDKWNYDPAKAQKILTSHGCKKGGDGIYSCGGKRMSFQFESTAGNQLRELAFEVMQQQLKANGIAVSNNFKPSNIYFGQDLPNGNYQLGMYAWSAPSADPSTGTAIYFCPNDGGGQNYTGYCNPQVDKLFKLGNTTLDESKRVGYYNKADQLISESVPTIPLFQKPTFLAYQNYVKGMTDNVLSAGPMWNAENWWLAK